MTDNRYLRTKLVEGVEEHTTGQENDGTSDVTGTGQRYGNPSIAREADFDRDNPRVVHAVQEIVTGGVAEPALTGNAPGQKPHEVFGDQKP